MQFSALEAYAAEVGMRFRVYPNWCAGLNPRATATQRAQAFASEEY